jgi:hypothetical protein
MSLFGGLYGDLFGRLFSGSTAGTIDDIWKLPYLPERTSYVYKQTANVVSVRLNGGMSKSRRDLIGSTSVVSCQWFLDNEEFEYFMAFYKVIAQEGARAFKADLLLDKPTVQEFDCKFIPDTLQSIAPSALSFNVSAELEVTPIEDTEKDLIWFMYNANPVEFESLLDKIASTVNTDFDVFGL